MRRRYLVFPLLVLFLTFTSSPTTAQTASDSHAKPNAPAAQSGKTNSDSITDSEIMDANDPMFGIPKMPHGKVSLIGGTVSRIDPIRQRITLRVFGSNKKMTFGYDERSHIFRDGMEATYKGVQQGERVYVDSMLDGTALFARNIRVVTTLRPADARGQITQYDPNRGVMVIRDELSSSPVTFHVSKNTKVTGNSADSRIDLVPGALVTVHFSSDHRKRDTAQEVSVLALPGSMFTFSGTVRYLNVKDGVIAVDNQSDNKTYELRFDPGVVTDEVTVGSNVSVAAEFQGSHYKAKTVKVSGANTQASSSE